MLILTSVNYFFVDKNATIKIVNATAFFVVTLRSRPKSHASFQCGLTSHTNSTASQYSGSTVHRNATFSPWESEETYYEYCWKPFVRAEVIARPRNYESIMPGAIVVKFVYLIGVFTYLTSRCHFFGFVIWKFMPLSVFLLCSKINFTAEDIY